MVIIFDNSILVSIIAINLTLIGLTSLAESKRVIGIDYGKFLVNEFIFFRFLGVKVKFRLKYWLLSFILLNGFAIISLFVLGDNEVIVLINGAVLSLCLITLLLYFYFYILNINKRVKQQIYISTMSAMYTSNNPLIDGVKRPHSFFDRHLDISDGKPTIRRLVTNVYKYFDDDSFAVQDAFEDIFGGDSFIYNQHKYKREIKYFVNRYIKLAHINSQDDYTESPYEYRKDSFGGYDISHEFFQMFRYTTLQSRWAYSMYFLAKGKSNSFITFSNLVRITCNCSLYGKTKGVRDYKFIQFLVNEYVKNMRDIEVIKSYKKRKDNILDPFGKEDESNEIDFDHIETLFIENLFRLLIASTIQVHEDKNYISLNELKMMYEKIINEKTILNKDTKIKIGKELKEVLQSLEGFDLVNKVIA